MTVTTKLKQVQESERSAKIRSKLLTGGCLDLESVAAQGKPVPMGYLLPAMIDRTDDRRYNRRPLDGISTGLHSLDNVLRGGFQEKQMYVLAGLPGSGKTNFALWCAYHAARKFQSDNYSRRQPGWTLPENPKDSDLIDKAVIIIEQEMTGPELYERLASMESGIPGMAVMLGGHYDASGHKIAELTDDEYSRWYAACEAVSELPIFLLEGQVSLGEMKRAIKTVEGDPRKYAAGLVIDDYLQLHTAPGKQYDNITYTARGLRNLNLELGVPFLVVSQSSRTAHENKDSRILPHNLGGSSEVEKAATTIVALQNPAVLAPGEEHPPLLPIEFDIIKNRTGPMRRIPAFMEAATGTFSDNSNELDYMLGGNQI